ncbi:MAG TPA: hypothetical protein VFO58_25905 [Vicinamibacterales bacterium]|nr:hypothetical protein [Vicinamibacterales bacterium]
MKGYIKALQYFREAYSILDYHCPRMQSRSEWNMAARAAYEAMEKVVKAVELLADVHLTTQHDVTLHQQVLDRLPLVAWRVDDDPMTSISLCAVKKHSPDLHVTLSKVSRGMFTSLASGRWDGSSPLSMTMSGSTIQVLSGTTAVFGVTDTTAGVSLEGHWIQVLISQPQVELLNDFLKSVSKGRNVSAYYGKVFDAQSAEAVRGNGMSLFVPVKRRVGHRIHGSPLFDGAA